MLLILGLGLATLIAALYVALNFWVVALLIKHAARIRLWATPKLDAAEKYAQEATPSSGRIFALCLILVLSLYLSHRLANETETLMLPLWWSLAVLGYTSSVLLAVPERWGNVIKELLSRLSYVSPLFIAALMWLSTGLASNQINAMFSVPATMLPFALAAYSFAISTFLVTAAITIFLLPFLVIFYIFNFVSGFSESSKNIAMIRRTAVFAAVYLLLQIYFFVAHHPIFMGYAEPVVARLALEFDFDDKVLCKNMSDEGKYLFLDGNKNLVLRVVPTLEWNMTPREIAKAQKREEPLSAIKEKNVVKCEFLS